MTKQVQDAYIVAATRTPVGKAPRGVFRNTRPDDMLAHVIRAVMAQAPGIDPHRIDDAIIGCAMPEAEQGMNVARIGTLLAGLPYTVPGVTINRFCSSGVQAIAMACTPEEQKRLMVTPGTVYGRPASRVPIRATFMPCSASGMAQPMMASSMRCGSMPGACAMTARITWASMSSGRVLRNTPRGALPTGVRVAATI